MGDQLGKVSDEEFNWLAGFVDGEGSFNLHRDQQKRWVGYKPWFTLGNTHVESLSRVTEILDRAGVAYHVSWTNDKRPDRKRLWRVSITGLKRVQRWIHVIGPYLFTKRKQAELLLDFVNLRLANEGWRRGLSAEEERLVPLLRTMNH